MRETAKGIKRRRKTFVKRLLYLAMVALVAMLMLAPTAALLIGAGVLGYAVLRRR